MQVRTYAKNNTVALNEVLETLTNNFGGDWSGTSKLTNQHTDYLDNVFTHQLTLPPQQEVKALPQAQTEQPKEEQPVNELVKAESSEIDFKDETSTDITPLDQLQIVTSDLEITHVQKNLDDDFQKFTDVFRKHDERKEAFLMNRLQATYQKVKTHKPVEPVTVKDNLSEVEKMMNELREMGIDIKSQRA